MTAAVVGRALAARLARRKAAPYVIVALLALLAVPSLALAQFGHPLQGQWSGQWGPKDKPNRLLLDLDWDGTNITGAINPGRNAATVRKVTFDYTNPEVWVVKMEAEGKDAAGAAVRIMVDGRLENIGAYRRVFRGTWTQGNQKGDFTLTRN
jgi:hypothetical protein